MDISYASIHKSITKFEALKELPNFIVLTGLNGSGKTQFLEAIQKGCIKIDDIQIGKIKLINNTSLKLKASSAFQPHIINGELQKILSNIHTQKRTHLKSVSDNFFGEDIFDTLSHKEIVQLSENKDALKEFIEAHYSKIIVEITDTRIIISRASNAIASDTLLTGIASKQNQYTLKSICNKANRKFIWHLTQDDIAKYHHPKTNLQAFEENLSEVFFKYYTFKKNFKNTQIENHKDSDKALKEVYNNIEKQFKENHGAQPWGIFNKLLSDAKLPFQVTHPEEKNIIENFSVQLITHSKNNILNLNDLSSGESVIFSSYAHFWCMAA